jgi:hypothetical protein
MSRVRAAIPVVALVLLCVPDAASGIPAFARKYGVSCQLCHAPVPRLTPYGEQFAANGFEIVVGEPPRDTVETGDRLLRLLRRIEIAVRMDLFGTMTLPMRSGAADADLQTPYAVKLLSGGALADRISYYMYFYMSERGEVAGLEDAYIQFTDIGSSGVSAIVGQFQVSDPLFKRELRLQYEDYQPYRVRVGAARADLTYDRGIMLSASPWDGGDLVLSAVNGRGLDEAAENRHYDRDNNKGVSLRYSQDIAGLRVGGFGYISREGADGFTDRITMWGPDATIAVGAFELNAQYLERRDSNPFFMDDPEETTVRSAFAEALYGPFGTDGRWALAALYNWIHADTPVVSLRLGDAVDNDGLSDGYHSIAGGVHYLLHRNVRVMTEAGFDLKRERTRLTLGATLAF